MKKFINLLWKILLILSILSFSSEAAKDKKKDKDDGKPKCVYCEKYKKLKDWPENERPIAFIYEKVDYPEGMFNEKEIKMVKSEKLQAKKRQGKAGGKVYIRFVKSKSTLNKYQHLMIRDMAYFEALYNEMLMDPDAKVETLESLKKGREAMKGIGGAEGASMNLGQVSASMGTGADASKALGSAAEAAEAASEAGSGIAEAAAGAAAASQEAAAAMGAMTGMEGMSAAGAAAEAAAGAVEGAMEDAGMGPGDQGPAGPGAPGPGDPPPN